MGCTRKAGGGDELLTSPERSLLTRKYTIARTVTRARRRPHTPRARASDDALAPSASERPTPPPPNPNITPAKEARRPWILVR